MNYRPRSLMRQRDAGQAMIFFAICISGLLLTTGVAVEGGRLFVQHRQMQAAADMAALVGAQQLPASTTTAESDACAYAGKNGFGSGTCGTSTICPAGTSSCTVTALAPPAICSPYDFVDYGNGALPKNGCSGTASSPTYYIDVTISQSLHIPIFNKDVTLSAHAVARNGEFSPKDYAITTLDPTYCDLDMSGSKSGGTLLMIGSAISNSTNPGNNNGCSIKTGGQGLAKACDGAWFTSANEAYPGQLTTYTGMTASFSPPDCVQPAVSPTPVTTTTATPDSPAKYNPNWFPVSDPYCTSINPNTATSYAAQTDCQGNAASPGSISTTCASCVNSAWVYTWDPSVAATATVNGSCPNKIGGRFHGCWILADTSQAGSTFNGSNKQSYELFPGIYPGGITMDGGNGQSYFNPGVYTLEGNFKANGGTVCIYGSPSCDGGLNNAVTGANCGNSNFSGTGAVNSDTWFYYCSPWGIWDTHSNLPSCTTTAITPACPPTAGPTFTDGSTPLNGVTFYLVNHASFQLGGNLGGSNNIATAGTMYLAFPNPCPGKGTEGGSSPNYTVPFPPNWGTGAASGDAAGVYHYPAGSLPYIDNNSAAVDSPAGEVYPSVDLTLSGECNLDKNVWPGEMGTGTPDPNQHLHFLIFARDSGSSISLTGNGSQTWWGILYNPGAAPEPSPGTDGCGNACTMLLNGDDNSPATGPPTFIGQMVADNIKFSGNAAAELFYRPCRPSTPCGSGPGTSLVQ
jgi:Putative Flp pilus-assembly TadE/G-like